MKFRNRSTWVLGASLALALGVSAQATRVATRVPALLALDGRGSSTFEMVISPTLRGGMIELPGRRIVQHKDHATRWVVPLPGPSGGLTPGGASVVPLVISPTSGGMLELPGRRLVQHKDHTTRWVVPLPRPAGGLTPGGGAVLGLVISPRPGPVLELPGRRLVPTRGWRFHSIVELPDPRFGGLRPGL